MEMPDLCSGMRISYLTEGTCLAVDLIRAVVFTVIKEVTAQRGADASAVGAQELILLTRGHSRRGHCKHITAHLGKVEVGERFHSSLKDSLTYSSPFHLTGRHSCRHHRTSSTTANIRGHSGSGKVWWEDTATFL